MVNRRCRGVLVVIIVIIVSNIPAVAGWRDKRLSVAKLYAIRKVKR